MHISKNIAALVNLNTFPTTADPVQLQRVANQRGGWYRISWELRRGSGMGHAGLPRPSRQRPAFTSVLRWLPTALLARCRLRG
jgi:hypothetical protein